MNKALNKYSKNAGHYIMITGVLHLVLGFIENWDAASDIWDSGIIDAVDETPERLSFFWYQMSGLFVILLGSFIQQYLNEYKKPIPKKHGYYLLTAGVIGCVLEPVSGFYVFILIAVPIIYSGNKNFITDKFDNNNSETNKDGEPVSHQASN